MRVVAVRDFLDHATEMFRSDDVILVTREGTPAGFLLPWDAPELPVEVREVFLRLSEQFGGQLAGRGIGGSEALDDSLPPAVVADANYQEDRLKVATIGRFRTTIPEWRSIRRRASMASPMPTSNTL